MVRAEHLDQDREELRIPGEGPGGLRKPGLRSVCQKPFYFRSSRSKSVNKC